MIWKIGFLALIAGAIVSVVLSTNIVVVRRLNPDTDHPHFADWFSNPQCSASTCPSRSTCAGGNCCMCQCLYDHPNVFVNRTSLRCTNYGEINSLSSANCQYSFRKPNEPLEVIPLTEIATGKIRFRNDSARVNCTENGLSVDKWQYLDVNGRFQNGAGNVFVVDFRTVGGHDRNKKDLTFLNWNAMLDTKYAGLIIKLSLNCAGRNVGCILAKINGTNTYNTSQSTTSAPPSTTTSQQPSTYSPSTPVPEETTTLPTPGPTPVSYPGPSTIKSGVPVVPGTDSISTKAPSRSAENQQASSKRVTAINGAVPALIAIAGLICLICLVCLIVALYKRRKRRLSEQPARDPEVDSEAKLEVYQDPVYAELPDNTQTAGDFDNPIYCDPTEEQFMRRSRLDPLPALPVDESTYQPLEQNTRTAPGPSAPTPPPVSSDYLNPDREEPDSLDYDNPPVTNQVMPMNNESSDYDNPPIQGNSPPMSTQRNDNVNTESSDYDNPPIQGNSPPMSTQRNDNVNTESSNYDNPPIQGNSPPMSTQRIDNLNTESSDYDNPPPIQDISQDVPGSTQGAVTEPEYLELEPEDSSL